MKITGVILGVLLGAFIIGGWLLPSTIYLERSIEIDAPPKVVFHEVNEPRNFTKWSPWAGIDPNTTYEFTGPKSGVGAKMSWASEHEDVGSGSQRIVESVENEKVINALEYGGFEGDFKASIILNEDDNVTNVTWTYEADMEGNMLAKFFGLFMDDMLGPFYEEGLQNLKRVVEAKPYDNLEIEEVEMQEIIYLGINQYMEWEDFSDLTQFMDNFYTEIENYAKEANVNVVGPPLARYSNYDEQKGVQMLYALPIDREIEVTSERVVFGKTYSGKAVKSVYKGNYQGMDPTYDIMEVFIHENGYHLQDTSWQVFQVDFRTEPDMDQWVTEIYLALTPIEEMGEIQ